MDSFLEEPRTTPRPTPIIQEIHGPTVPEVSLMFQNSKRNKPSIPNNYGKSMQSYNAWKLRSDANVQKFDSFLLTNTTNKENVLNNHTTDKSFLSKKQVRFESPVQTNLPVYYPIAAINIDSTCISDASVRQTEKHISNFKLKHNASPISSKTKEIIAELQNDQLNKKMIFPEIKPTEPTKVLNKPFEKFYISNLPNKELDLSFLEPQKNPCGPIKIHNPLPTTSGLSSLKINDNFNSYSSNINKITPNFSESVRNLQPKTPEIDSIINTEIKKPDEVISTEQKDENLICDPKICDNKNPDEQQSKQSSNDSVTVSDLLTIIKMQNEQLQLLQNQVNKLVKLNEKAMEEKQEKATNNSTENKKQVIICKDQQVETTEDSFESHQETTKKENKKISVGMMTSFEVSFKPPKTTKMKQKQKILNLEPVEDESRYSSDFDQEQEYYAKPPKRQENKKNKRHYQQERRIPRQWQYYQERKETEYSLGSQECLEIQEPPESPENSIHIDMQEYDTDSSDDECSTDSGWTFYKDILGQVNNILENSRQPHKPKKEFVNKHFDDNFTDTTLDQIKQATVKKLQSSNNQLQIKPSEVSFAVKQILMKYLPDDELPNAIKNQEHFKNDTRKNDISITAFQYKQQYYGRKGKNIKKTPSRTDPKILDITTLKQQPKFL